MIWEDLKEAVKNSENKFSRTEEVSEKYSKYLKEHNDVSLKQHIHKEYLNTTNYCIILNDYPYHLADNIRHYVMWISEESNLTKDEIQDIIQKTFFPREVIVYKNIKKNQSVVLVEHYHIFVKWYDS